VTEIVEMLDEAKFACKLFPLIFFQNRSDVFPGRSAAQPAQGLLRRSVYCMKYSAFTPKAQNLEVRWIHAEEETWVRALRTPIAASCPHFPLWSVRTRAFSASMRIYVAPWIIFESGFMCAGASDDKSRNATLKNTRTQRGTIFTL
jgi:hypothetical protein